ncbi:MAG: energy transducer TonB [Bacteroidota bacterium]
MFFLIAMRVDIPSNQKDINFTTEQEVLVMEDIIQTQQEERPPAPPKPQVPVEVPNDEIFEETDIDISADIDLGTALDLPPAPEETEEDREDFFVVVEQMPELKGGLAGLQQCVKYPNMARKAGIEGRVIVQFIVNKDGQVENPRVIRGIGGGADQEALRCVEQAEFQPGMQRGVPVRVQYSLPVIFRLQN